LRPPGRLLDFGCATGHIAEAFLDFEYYGVDLDPKVIEAARARFESHENMHFLAVDLHSRPFSPRFFDEVIFAGTVHHLDDSTFASLLGELHYCLKPGGRVHIVDPILQDTDLLQQRLLRRLDRGKYSRTASQILSLVESLHLFEIGDPSVHPTPGLLIRDCDFLHLPLERKD
jgi:SAM-dependent methyltransferase